MKFPLLVILLTSAINANQCSPKKSNPKNEQCAKDLMKDGIESLPEDIQNKLMEPLVRKFAKKLMKDMLDDDDCNPKKPQKCSATAADFFNPFSDEGKTMFEQANKVLTSNTNQLVKKAEEKIGEIGKGLKDDAVGNFKQRLENLHLPKNLTAGILNVPDHLTNLTQHALGEALGVMKKQIELNIGEAMDGAGKWMDGLKDKATKLPISVFDFINKNVNERTGDQLNLTLSAFNGELKGVMSVFIEGLTLDEIKNITGGGFENKMEWIKSKLSRVVAEYGAQFGIESKAVVGRVFTDIIAEIPRNVIPAKEPTLTTPLFNPSTNSPSTTTTINDFLEKEAEYWRRFKEGNFTSHPRNNENREV